jgi:hypothetical protein
MSKSLHKHIGLFDIVEDLKKLFKSGFTELVEQEMKKKELEGKAKPSNADKKEIEKHKKKIEELLDILRALAPLAARYKWHKTIDDFKKCEDGKCNVSNPPNDHNEVSCLDPNNTCKGGCKCRMFFSLIGSSQTFEANGLLPDSNHPKYYKSEYYNLSCVCVK